jgi:amino acid transporter
VTRYVSAAIAALMTWNLFFVSTTSSAQISLTAQRELADKTGVLQDLASSDFLVSSAVSLWSGIFLAAVVLNILALGMVALLLQERSLASMAKRDRVLPEDLWGDQN